MCSTKNFHQQLDIDEQRAKDKACAEYDKEFNYFKVINEWFKSINTQGITSSGSKSSIRQFESNKRSHKKIVKELIELIKTRQLYDKYHGDSTERDRIADILQRAHEITQKKKRIN